MKGAFVPPHPRKEDQKREHSRNALCDQGRKGCAEHAETYGHSFAHEVSSLTVHSVLHLLGYDHVDEGEDKRRMRAREKEIMRLLDV